MGVQAVQLVTVQVQDFDQMVAWYRDVLDLAVGWIEPGEFCTLVAPAGGAAIALATDHRDRISRQPGAGWTPIFSVDDFEVTVALLRERGVVFDAEEEGAEEGYRLMRIEDPEGNAVGISA